MKLRLSLNNSNITTPNITTTRKSLHNNISQYQYVTNQGSRKKSTSMKKDQSQKNITISQPVDQNNNNYQGFCEFSCDCAICRNKSPFYTE